MMPAELLADLEQRGVRLWIDGDQLGIRAPKGALTTALRDELLRHKAAIMPLLRGRIERSSVVPDQTNRSQPFPLTDMQQAYLLGRSSAFELGNIGCHYYMEFEGRELDIQRLNRTWQQLIARHDMLRAVIVADGQQQILEEVPDYLIEVTDLRGHSAETVTQHLENTRSQMCHQVFEPGHWPLHEVRVSLLDHDSYRLHVDVDFLFVDARSLFFLLKEWSRLYNDPGLELEPLELSFRDCVLEETLFQESEGFGISREHWLKRLAGMPPAPELPRSPNLTGKRPDFRVLAGRLEKSQWSRLKSRARDAGLTPSGVLCAAFAEAVAMWARRPQFTLNLTTFTRGSHHPQIGQIVGDFTSTLLLEIDASGATFIERARRLQRRMGDDLEHAAFSGVRCLHELSRKGRNATAAAMPVVFTSFLGHKDVLSENDSLNLPIGRMTYSIGITPQVWLDHAVYEAEGGLVFNWYIVEELFPEGLLRDMFDGYCRVLSSLADHESMWDASTLPVISPAQVAQRQAINATDAPLSQDLLQTLFTTQVPKRHSQPAVITSSRSLSYEELYRRAIGVAQWLRKSGAQPNTLVAVSMKKGWEQVVAVMGVLLSGAAYIPVDPDLPKERFQYLLEHSEVQLALTQSWLDAKLSWPTVTRLCVDTLEPSAEEATLTPLQGPEDLAYVIYTSGSTGVPKGVMIDHRGAVNTILDLNRRFRITSGDRVFALSSLSFDLSVYDIFGILAAGATIVVPDSGTSRDPSHWLNLMARHGVTIWNSVPALMKMLVEFLSGTTDALPDTLRLVMLSGDWIPLSLPQQLKTLANNPEVISLGGATEASIWSILYPIDRVDPSWTSVPYGRPMVNQSFHVLTETFQPTPVWVTGQLYIGGVGLAKGYWRDAEKTRTSFVHHPVTGERLYRTGDLGRYLPDGNIEFLGREDFQVKIQGYRIELGEVEAALLRHSAVTNAVVCAVGSTRENKRLVGYVVVRPVMEGVLQDAAARLEFKLQRQGLRSYATENHRVQLRSSEPDETTVQTYTRRRSHRRFCQDLFGLDRFSDFLTCLRQIEVADGSPKYRYPSAGSLYPVQTYLYVKPNRVEGLAGGTYYYHPVDHRLVLIQPDAVIHADAHFPDNRSVFEESAFSIFLIAQLRAITPMYGDLSRDFCVLEAGYMSQLMMTAAADFDVGLCPVGNLHFEKIRHFFDLEESHLLVHSLLAGRIADQAHSLPTKTKSLSDDIRAFLKEHLPEMMVPSTIVVMDSLPLTQNGKVDRAALPSPDVFESDRSQQYAAPETDNERLLTGIIQEVIGLAQVGIHDNFFDMGANSLQMVQVHRRLRELKEELSIVDLFTYPTVHALAKRLSQKDTTNVSIQQAQARAKKRIEAMSQRQAPGKSK